MTRAFLIAGLLIVGVGAASTDARTSMTIVETTTRTYPGFRVRLTYQIGCATTDDDPSEETVKAAQADQARVLNGAEPTLKRAFEFFAKGDHPFTRLRKYQVSEPSDQESAECYWQNIQVTLFVRRDTPDIIRRKLAFDFMLALAFDPEFQRTTPFSYPTDPKAQLSELTARHDWVTRFVAHACRHPETVRGWDATPIDPATMGSQHGYDEAHRRIKARALQRILDRKPYGSEMLTDAAKLSRTEGVRDLMMLSSDAQAAELKAVLDLLPDGYRDARAYYEPLL